jgi:uncharacterized Tic20 family protein
MSKELLFQIEYCIKAYREIIEKGEGKKEFLDRLNYLFLTGEITNEAHSVVKALILNPENIVSLLLESSKWSGSDTRKSENDLAERTDCSTSVQVEKQNSLLSKNGKSLLRIAPEKRDFKKEIESLVAANPGQCSVAEYSLIVEELQKSPAGNFLVFGLGNDSKLWLDINRGGKTVFLEDQAEWIEMVKEIKTEEVSGELSAENQVVSSDEKMFGMLCHLLSIFAGFLAPLIIWLIKKDNSRYIDSEGKSALNFQISLIVYYTVLTVISTVLTFITFGIFGMIAPLLYTGIWVFSLVVTILASVQANGSGGYNYPLSIKFIS